MATSKPTKQSPADVARETFKQLSALRIQPTPDAYQKLYNEIAGIDDVKPNNTAELEAILLNLAISLIDEGKEFADIGKRLKLAAERKMWADYHVGLKDFIEKIVSQLKLATLANAVTPSADAASSKQLVIAATDSKQTALLKDLLTRTLNLALPSLLSTAPELAQESDALALLLKQAISEKEFADIAARLKNLCFKIEHLPNAAAVKIATPAGDAALPLVDDPIVGMLSKLLSQTLGMALGALLHNEPKLLEASDQLAADVKAAKSLAEFQGIESRIRDLCYKISLKGDDSSEQLQLLLSLFKLLLENVTSLLDDDNWLRGQVIVIQELIAGEIDHRALLEATRSLKDVIYKQGVLKDSIAQNKLSVKQLMDLFVDRLSIFANTTGEYHEKITGYSGKITQETSPEAIQHMLENLMQDTLLVQNEAKQSHELMVAAKKEVHDAEVRIGELEKKLAEMSEQVHKDQLTGSLNRRGLDEIFEREASRADRRNMQLCVGMLDIDNFKKLNDTFGHSAGDGALVHLVNVIKKTLRSMDVVARYGGEEFVIIMPETGLKDAADTMMRLQRELTKHFFMAGEERILITFSAGVAQRQPQEPQDILLRRADKAMYEAKNAGKNRVIAAA